MSTLHACIPALGIGFSNYSSTGKRGTPASTRRGRKTSTTTLQLGFQVMRRAVPERIMWLFQIYVKSFLPEALWARYRRGQSNLCATSGCIGDLRNKSEELSRMRDREWDRRFLDQLSCTSLARKYPRIVLSLSDDLLSARRSVSPRRSQWGICILPPKYLSVADRARICIGKVAKIRRLPWLGVATSIMIQKFALR